MYRGSSIVLPNLKGIWGSAAFVITFIIIIIIYIQVCSMSQSKNNIIVWLICISNQDCPFISVHAQVEASTDS